MVWHPKITPQERRLLSALHLRKIHCISNPKVCGYYPDIQISGTNILIEVDGWVHRGRDAKSRDRQRTRHLNLQGYRVLRFTNEQIEQQLPAVIVGIEKAIERAQSGKSGLRFRKGSPAQRQQAKRARAKARELNQANPHDLKPQSKPKSKPKPQPKPQR